MSQRNRATAPPVNSQSEASPSADALNLGALLDVEVPITISFGQRDLPLGDILKLSSGSVVDLDRAADDDVDILVNNQVIASGELVEVDGQYGVRIKELLTAAQPPADFSKEQEGG